MNKDKIEEKFTETREINENVQKKIKQAFENSNLSKKKIYGIRDTNAGFQNVFIGQNDGIVYRDLYSQYKAAKESKQPNPMIDFPDNFSLWAVAEINEETNQVRSVMVELIRLDKLIELYN